MPNQYGAPSLGYGQRSEAPIDAFNQWLRARPEYQSLIQSFGQTPNNVHLNDAQKQSVVRLAQSLGAVVDEGHNGQEVDDSGNFQAKSHALRNTLIIGGLAAATLLTAGGAGLSWGIGPAWGTATGAGTAAGSTVTALDAGGTALGAAGAAGAGTSAATAATVAGAGAAASKGVSSWLAPLIGVGSNVAGNLIGAKMQADSSKDAAAIQAQSVKDALDFEKNQYADLTGRLAPYVAAGTAASDRQNQLLGNAPRPGTSATSQPTYGPPVANYSTQPVARTAAPATEQQVTLQAPDGSTKQVPQSQAAYYISKGAKQVAA